MRSQLSDSTRETILEAATRRLLHYGYNKTTMAEIACDAGMSAANLYRYFDNKQEIVMQCTSRTLDARLTRLRSLVEDTSLSAADRLVRYALELIAVNHDLAKPESRIGELVDMVTHERPDLIHSKNELHYELIARILADGNTSGEFAVDDTDACARTIHTAFFLFDVPLFVGLYDREEFVQRARDLVTLLITGLGAAGSSSASRP